ncbi:hypothetical protein CROQUDRAFT_48662 [Cronartium quercuum f. sp. fusiforme G11]|uniref:Carbonic anhydrase n=1 Tax=Cronartium quercuum f. sp. fusiforme G11 TaxID=708437 RepID=A0A9P6NCS6_9BASI|nr:hypothetical protein CROQUDRAFT_48662 [Cronartium quercuum f. sp. fusiforme G11]
MSDFLQRNAEFAEKTNSSVFRAAEEGQTPKLLWIGCSDSRAPANTVIGSNIGEVFLYKNVANVFTPTDTSAVAAVAYAVNVLKVPNIVVVGHTQCGGCSAAMSAASRKPGASFLPGTQQLNEWIEPIRILAIDELRRNRNADLDTLIVANVRQQFYNLARHPVIRAAWARGQALEVHGWIYNISTGRIQDLGLTQSGH